MDKANLRNNIQNTIRQISASDKTKENAIIFDIRQKELLPRYTNRAIYISIPSEVNTENIIQSILSSGKKCFLPVEQGENFFFTEITKNTQYKKNQYGIQEPINPQKSIDEPDAILVPGLAFTVNGKRLGRGLGRYDKLLAQHAHTIKIGTCFQKQIIDHIPTQAHDQYMDIILSTQLYFRS